MSPVPEAARRKWRARLRSGLGWAVVCRLPGFFRASVGFLAGRRGMELVGGGGGSSSTDPRSTYVLSNLAEVVERVFTFLPAKALLRVAG